MIFLSSVTPTENSNYNFALGRWEKKDACCSSPSQLVNIFLIGFAASDYPAAVPGKVSCLAGMGTVKNCIK